jgi:putative transposase
MNNICMFIVSSNVKPSVLNPYNEISVPEMKIRDRPLQNLLFNSTTQSKSGVRPPMACKLVYDKGTRIYEIHIPMKRKQIWAETAYTENQGCAQAIALDPGVRTFLTGYQADGMVTKFADGDIKRLCRLAATIDKLTARLESPEVRHKDRLRLKRTRFRIYTKITNLVSESHWKIAHYLCSNYDVILLPSFGTQDMVKKIRSDKKRRKIGKDTARRMLMWSHYKFRCRLMNKARQWGKTVVIVNEAYTSKTCTRCGWQNHKLGGAKLFKCKQCYLRVDRDVNGARNILLRNTCI